MKVINLFAGPGAGKSTTAAGIFNHLKNHNKRCELVTEFVKDLVWDKSHATLRDPLYLLANQHHKLHRMLEHDVDYIIVDSPLPVCLAYMDEYWKGKLENLVFDMFDRFDNDNYFLIRQKQYMKYGRFQTEDEANSIDTHIENFMKQRYDMRYITGTPQAASLIAANYLGGEEDD